jgi:hypothetical protein
VLQIALGVFTILHGLVFLLYFGQSWRLFELQSGMVWPDGSWAFSQRLGNDRTRMLACITCGLAALGFIVGGIGILAEQAWWRPVIVSVAAFSAIAFILFWDGTRRQLDDQGGIGLLINGALILAAFIA